MEDGPKEKVYPGDSFSVGSELAGAECCFPATEQGCGLCDRQHRAVLRGFIEVLGH